MAWFHASSLVVTVTTSLVVTVTRLKLKYYLEIAILLVWEDRGCLGGVDSVAACQSALLSKSSNGKTFLSEWPLL